MNVDRSICNGNEPFFLILAMVNVVVLFLWGGRRRGARSRIQEEPAWRLSRAVAAKLFLR